MNNTAEFDEKWNVYDFKGKLSISVPLGTELRNDKFGKLLVAIGLRSGEVSDLVVAISDARVERPLTRAKLREEASRIVLELFGIDNATYEAPVDFEKEGFLACQALMQIETDIWWIARIFCRKDGNKVLMACWKGPAFEMKSSLIPILVTIDPHLEV